MRFELKRFRELTNEELYRLLRLRSEVFVVEQACPYQDLDGKDQEALHLLGYENGNLVAYSRLFEPDENQNHAVIGRVVVNPNERKKLYGKKLMTESITQIRKLFGNVDIILSAQHYLLRFYNQLGFKEYGEIYLEDDIPHINMINKVN